MEQDEPVSEDRRELLRYAASGAVLAGAGALAASTAHAAGARHVLATTRAGRVRGYVDRGISVFKGVAYGGDTATRRFRPAVAPESWKGVRDAFEYGAACPQTSGDERASEDCLKLNIWTPALRDGGKRPVMVYVHGGEFSSGSGSSPLYDGVNLCRRGDVVVVTLNHRLNAFGHLYLSRLAGPQFAASGNIGILDLVLALLWVRDHALEIGGDPGCVTVFGQSGGGAKIATLMATPAARGLFHRAATMSGQQITACGPRGATARARAFLDALGVESHAIADAGAVSIERLVGGLRTADPTITGRSLYFGPVLDHEVLMRHPFFPDAPDQSSDVPMMIGNTREETRAFLGEEPGIHSLSWDELPARLLPDLYVDLSPEYVIAQYRRFYPQYTPTEVFFAATTAGRSWRGAVIEAELRAAQGSPVYAYQLDYRSPLNDGKYGAMHAMDIPLVFDNWDRPESLTGRNDAARATAEQMADAFIAFARTGNPNHPKLPHWQPYDLTSRATMVFNAQSHLVNDPRGDERKLLAQVPYIQRGTY